MRSAAHAREDGRIRGIVSWCPLEKGDAARAELEALAEYDLAFHLRIGHRHTRVAASFVDRCPNVRIVLDHIGKPDIKGGGLEPWRSEIRELARSSARPRAASTGCSSPKQAPGKR
ncbi:MAG: amidohydrolase family protein [Spirochaetota bacterium]